jgi:hypothetical protein
MNRQIMNLDNRHGWLADGITGMAGCVLHSIVGFVLLGCLPRSPFQTKVSQDQSVHCLIIYTLYPHLYRIQFKYAAFRDNKSPRGW